MQESWNLCVTYFNFSFLLLQPSLLSRPVLPLCTTSFPHTLLFLEYPEYGSSRLLQNVGTYVPVYTVSSYGLDSSLASLWEPQILQHDASWYSVLFLQSHHLIPETDTEQHYHRGKVPNVKEISYCIIKMCVIFSVGGSRIIGWCDFNSLLLGCAIYSPPYLANVTYVTFAAK